MKLATLKLPTLNLLTSRLSYRSCLLGAAVCLLLAGRADARNIYVDNRKGSDVFDGYAREPTDFTTGPTRSIRRALRLARTGDTVILANTGVPYYEPIQLVGSKMSGYRSVPFTLIGNGAIVSGARPIPPRAWRKVGDDLWKVSPYRKGYYQLILGDKKVPEHPLAPGLKTLPEIPEGHWSAWRGAMYYRSPPLEEPPEKPFSFAAWDTGLTLFSVRDVRIEDVTFRHFRLDGINAHDLCQRVVLKNVTSLENGRAGLSVNGSSSVFVRDSKLIGNRKHSLLLTELGAAALDKTNIDRPPTVKNSVP